MQYLIIVNLCANACCCFQWKWKYLRLALSPVEKNFALPLTFQWMEIGLMSFSIFSLCLVNSNCFIALVAVRLESRSCLKSTLKKRTYNFSRFSSFWLPEGHSEYIILYISVYGLRMSIYGSNMSQTFLNILLQSFCC